MSKHFAIAVLLALCLAGYAYAACRDTPGYRDLHVVALTTLPDEEKAENPSYTGTFAAEGLWLYRGYKLWEEVVNNGTGIVVRNTTHTITWCVNMTIANFGGDGSISGNDTDGRPLSRGRALTRRWTDGSKGPIFGGKNVPDVFFGPYSSTLTVPFALETETAGVVSLNPGPTFRPNTCRACDANRDNSVLFYSSNSSQPDCWTRRAPDGSRRFKWLYGVQPPANNAAFPAVTLMRLRDVKTVATWYENQPFTKSIIDGALEAAAFNKINITGTFSTVRDPTYDQVFEVAKSMKALNPDAVIAGTYYTSCKPFIQAMRALNWTPKAIFSSLCTASRPESVTELRGDERYIIDYLEWDHRLAGPDYVDPFYFKTNATFTTPAPQQFYDLHVQRWGEPPFHFTALAFSLGTVVHKLLETTGEPNQELWRQALGSFLMTSFSGKISFDGWGQNPSRDVIMEQRDVNSTVQVLYPLGAATADIVFPIPRFDERTFNVSYLGAASETGIVVFTAILMAVSVVLLIFLAFTFDNPWIYASSPMFLAFILLGSLIEYSTVFAWAKQATDASCILRYWLLVCGFVLMFGSLFAKTYRVMRIFNQKRLVVGLKITNKEVGLILVVAVTIAVILLAIWTGTARPASVYGVFDPVRPVYTIISCSYSTADTVFLILIMIYIGVLIITGIVMSARIWNIPSKVFNEAKQIGFSMYNMFFFLVICFGLQISNAIAPEAMFILRSLCINLSTFITIIVIFAPKVLAVIRKKNYQSTQSSATITRSHISVMNVSNTTSSGSDESDRQSELNKNLTKTKKELADTRKELADLRQKYNALLKETGKVEEETESSDDEDDSVELPAKKPAMKTDKKPAATEEESSSSEEEEQQKKKKTPTREQRKTKSAKSTSKSAEPAKKAAKKQPAPAPEPETESSDSSEDS